MVQVYGFQPHGVFHAQAAQQGLRICRMAFNGADLRCRQGVELLRQLVLQPRHGNVHAQGRAAELAHALGRPLQHLARRHHAGHADQHGMGGAVHLRLLCREQDQGQQRGIGGLAGVALQFLVQGMKARQKVLRLGQTQQLGGLQLQLGPGPCALQCAQARARRRRCGDGGRSTDLHHRDFAQLGVGIEHLAQLGDERAMAVARLFGVDAQVHTPGQQGL